MDLSSELISQFVKATKDTAPKTSEATIYGTTVEYNGTVYVKLDGSERLTPVETTVALEPNERVTVLVKNHTATVTGNISSPAARNSDVEAIKGTIAEFDTVIADKIDAKTANIELAIIDKLDGKYATFDAIEAAEAEIKILKASNVTINEKLTARDAEIDQLKANSLTVEVADAKYATIKELEATNSKFNSLESTYGEFVDLTTEKFEALEGSIADLDVEKLDAKYATIAVLQSDYITAEEIASTYITASKVDADYAKISTLEADYIKTKDLEANYLTADIIKSKYAEIDLANVTTASMGTLLANIGLITSATIVDGHVTGYLDSVEVNANNITAGTLTVDRLIISGSDKSIIYAINNAGELTSTETDTIDGDVITKRTIAADHIIAGTITSNEIHSSAVTADKIATNAVTADKIAANAIISGKIAANAITADKIAADAVTADKINVVDLKALGATIGTFNIGDKSIYSGTKSTVSNTSRGIYMDTDGQVNLGDSNNYLKFYKDQNGTYKLAIAAESLTFGSGTSVADAFNDVASDISTAQTTANNAVNVVNNLQVGGRNLILNTSEDFTVGPDTSNFAFRPVYTALEVGETYTFSAEITVEGTSNPQVSILPYNHSTGADGGSHVMLANGTRQSVTFTINNSTPYLLLYAGIAGATAGITATYHHVKLEKGNKPTDWTPAPEDVDAGISNAQTVANNANTAANNAVNAVNNLQVGGRNYFSTKTQKVFDSDGTFRLQDYENVGSFSQLFNFTVPMSTFVGKECMLSFDIISPNGETPLQVYNINGDARYAMNVTGIKTPISTSWTSQKLKVTVTDRGSNYNADQSNKLEIYCPNKMGCKIRNVKFEFGNKSTDWTPAPEDVATNISEAAKTATNYMSFDTTNGLIVSQDATANAGNVQIKSDGFRIRNGTTVNASFLGNTITLGQNSSDSYINLCGDKGTIHVGDKARYDGTATDALYIDSEDITLYGEYSISSILHSPLTSGLTTTALGYMHVTSSLTSVSGTNVYLPEIHLGTITNDTELGQVSTLLALSRNSATLSYDNNGIWCQSDGVHVKAYNGDRVFLSVYDSEIDPYIEITPSSSTATTRIYMAARNINLDAINMTTIDSPATVNGLLTANGGIMLPNGVAIQGLNTAGVSRGLIHYAADNSTYVGYGGYAASEGCHYICGNEIRYLTRASTSTFVPYYKAGDSVSLEWTGAGFITSSSTVVWFTVPLSKPVIGNPTVTVTSVDGIVIRQTAKYLYGSGASAWAKPSSYTATLGSTNFVKIRATMANTTNVVNNNEACGVVANIKITFS